MQTSDHKNYISLQEATEYCDYSQEYLSLRARHGKLKAIKFGRNWVTKKEWLEEYLEKVKEYQKNDQALEQKQRKTETPKSLPVSTEGEKRKRPAPKFRFGFALGLIFVLLITGIVLGKNSFINIYEDILSCQKINQVSNLTVKKTSQFSSIFAGQISKFIVFITAKSQEAGATIWQSFGRALDYLDIFGKGE